MTETNFWQLFSETGDLTYYLLYQEAISKKTEEITA